MSVLTEQQPRHDEGMEKRLCWLLTQGRLLGGQVGKRGKGALGKGGGHEGRRCLGQQGPSTGCQRLSWLDRVGQLAGWPLGSESYEGTGWNPHHFRTLVLFHDVAKVN